MVLYTEVDALIIIILIGTLIMTCKFKVDRNTNTSDDWLLANKIVTKEIELMSNHNKCQGHCHKTVHYSTCKKIL